MLNLNCALILLSVCRNIITLLRTTPLNRVVPLDKNITMHKVIAWTILIFSMIHVGSHYFNFLHIEQGTGLRLKEGLYIADAPILFVFPFLSLLSLSPLSSSFLPCLLSLSLAGPNARSNALLPAAATASMVAMGTVAGVTGHALVVTMLIMYTAAQESVRRKYFELFWYSHHLFILFFALLLSHGAQCLIRPQSSNTVSLLFDQSQPTAKRKTQNF